jgi:hypothetical protein
MAFSITKKFKENNRGKGKKRRLVKNDNVGKVQGFLQELTRLIKQDKKWRHFCYSFVITN